MIRRVFSKRDRRHVYSIDLTLAGERIRSSGYATRQEAAEAIATLRLRDRSRRVGLIVPDDTTLGDLLDRWQPAETRSPRLRHVAAFVAAVGRQARIVDIRSSDLRRYQSHLLKTCKPGSVSTYLSYITAFLNSAPVYFPSLDDYRAPLLPTSGRKGQRSRILSRAEILLILAELRSPAHLLRATSRQSRRDAIADLLIMLILTGARVGELLSLDLRAVDWDRSTVTIARTKTDTSSIIPLGAQGRAILQRYPRGWPFTYALVRAYLKQTSERLGIAYGDREAGGWVIHDLRHTAASLLAEAGINESVIAELLGHQKRGTTGRIYTHASLPALRSAVEVLEIFCRDFDGMLGKTRPEAASSGKRSLQASTG